MKEYDILFVKMVCNNVYNVIDHSIDLTRFKYIKKFEQLIYQLGDLQLVIEGTNKKCVQLKNVDQLIVDKNKTLIMINQKDNTDIPIDYFPFIDKYDMVINQAIDVYKLNENTFIWYIREKNDATKNITSYYKIISHDMNFDIDKFIKAIV